MLKTCCVQLLTVNGMVRLIFSPTRATYLCLRKRGKRTLGRSTEKKTIGWFRSVFWATLLCSDFIWILNLGMTKREAVLLNKDLNKLKLREKCFRNLSCALLLTNFETLTDTKKQRETTADNHLCPQIFSLIYTYHNCFFRLLKFWMHYKFGPTLLCLQWCLNVKVFK